MINTVASCHVTGVIQFALQLQSKENSTNFLPTTTLLFWFTINTFYVVIFRHHMSLFPEKKARKSVANVRFGKPRMYWNFTRITLKVTVSLCRHFTLVGFNNCLVRVQKRSCFGLEYLFLLSWPQKHSLVSRLMLKHSPERWSLAPQLSRHHPILLQTPSSHTRYLNVIYKM